MLRYAVFASLLVACGTAPVEDLQDTGSGPPDSPELIDGAGFGDSSITLTCESTEQALDPITVRRDCTQDSDCQVGFHQTDCCGSLLALGIREDRGKLDTFETSCWSQGPFCRCAPSPTLTDMGEAEFSSDIGVRCVEQVCTSCIDCDR